MKTVLITGANRGIGLGFATYYANSGWHVYACCRSPEEAVSLKHLSDSTSTVSLVSLDVTQFSDIQKLPQTLESKPIDLLINNAGILGDHESFETTDPNFWLKAFEVNAIAPFLIAKALLPNLQLGQSKLIANISSRLGSMDENQSGGYYCYRSSKAALNAVTKSMSVDLKNKNIIVIALHPGWVKTDMGGKDAQIPIEESVDGLAKIFDTMQLKNSGQFINYQGNLLNW